MTNIYTIYLSQLSACCWCVPVLLDIWINLQFPHSFWYFKYLHCRTNQQCEKTETIKLDISSLFWATQCLFNLMCCKQLERVHDNLLTALEFIYQVQLMEHTPQMVRNSTNGSGWYPSLTNIDNVKTINHWGQNREKNSFFVKLGQGKNELQCHFDPRYQIF